jgi:polyhydroxyalkanoate synthesis regulator phasin
MEIEKRMKSQMEAMLESENLGKRSRPTDASITNRVQEMEERLQNIKDNIEDINT